MKIDGCKEHDAENGLLHTDTAYRLSPRRPHQHAMCVYMHMSVLRERARGKAVRRTVRTVLGSLTVLE